MINVDYKDRRPIYVQIIDSVKMMISTGALSRNEKLPSVRALSMELGINPNTIQRAYSELERQGVIATVQGKGVFVYSTSESVNEEKKREIAQKISALYVEAESLGIEREELERLISEYDKRAGKNGGAPENGGSDK